MLHNIIIVNIEFAAGNAYISLAWKIILLLFDLHVAVCLRFFLKILATYRRLRSRNFDDCWEIAYEDGRGSVTVLWPLLRLFSVRLRVVIRRYTEI